MKEKAFTCICCPAGCRLVARQADGSSPWLVEGNRCDRGRVYAIAEMTDPTRTVTAVVRTASESLPYAPVRTDKPIRRALVFPLLDALNAFEGPSDFKTGDVALADFESSGVNVVFTRDSE